MSFQTQPDVGPPQNRSVAAFDAAPGLVKVLAAFLYLEALLSLGRAVTVIAGLSDDILDVMVNAGLVFLSLGLAVVPFLLAKRIARGRHGTWLLTLVLAVVKILFDLRSLLVGVRVSSLLCVILPLAVLGLLLTPVVRRHCMKPLSR